MAEETPRKRRWGGQPRKPLADPPWYVDPVDQLRQSELTSESRDTEALIRVLQQRNDDPHIAARLWEMVLDQDSVAAATALQGSSARPTADEIASAIVYVLKGAALLEKDGSFTPEARRMPQYQQALYMTRSIEPRYVSPCAPLALARSSGPGSIDLLLRAARFRTNHLRSKCHERKFRQYAAGALTYNDQAFAKLVHLMLKTWDLDVYESARQGFLGYASKCQKATCCKYASLPRRKATFRIARDLQGKAAIFAFLAAVWPRPRYRQLLSDVKTIANSRY